ncbi:hypothetical protein H072_6028 [Dactylellina haptotyla CBS 200.50]|uniref:Clr5 domain-containing protein n=1 Tax=Dactylellina haptotyla (strain CBS 200.50) TaxID=1284197 RepID=S8AB51_DACHA|nr:hypothetical protein H072_6028 [Dactylellina haptotyla CBS 200.50]
MPPDRTVQRKERERAIPAWEWESVKSDFVTLYTVNKLSLSECISSMKTDQGFVASRRQYLAKIREWNIDKNIKAPEMRAAIRKVLERWVLEGKDTNVRVRGREIDKDKIKRFLRRQFPPTETSNQLEMPRGILYDINEDNEARTTDLSRNYPPPSSIYRYNRWAMVEESLQIKLGSPEASVWLQGSPSPGLGICSPAPGKKGCYSPSVVALLPRTNAVDKQAESTTSEFEVDISVQSRAEEMVGPVQLLWEINTYYQDDGEVNVAPNAIVLCPKKLTPVIRASSRQLWLLLIPELARSIKERYPRRVWQICFVIMSTAIERFLGDVLKHMNDYGEQPGSHMVIFYHPCGSIQETYRCSDCLENPQFSRMRRRWKKILNDGTMLTAAADYNVPDFSVDRSIWIPNYSDPQAVEMSLPDKLQRAVVKIAKNVQISADKNQSRPENNHALDSWPTEVPAAETWPSEYSQHIDLTWSMPSPSSIVDQIPQNFYEALVLYQSF